MTKELFLETIACMAGGSGIIGCILLPITALGVAIYYRKNKPARNKTLHVIGVTLVVEFILAISGLWYLEYVVMPLRQ